MCVVSKPIQVTLARTWDKPSDFQEYYDETSSEEEDEDEEDEEEDEGTSSEWVKIIDPKTNLPYYYNKRTGERTWSRPSGESEDEDDDDDDREDEDETEEDHELGGDWKAVHDCKIHYMML